MVIFHGDVSLPEDDHADEQPLAGPRRKAQFDAENVDVRRTVPGRTESHPWVVLIDGLFGSNPSTLIFNTNDVDIPHEKPWK